MATATEKSSQQSSESTTTGKAETTGATKPVAPIKVAAKAAAPQPSWGGRLLGAIRGSRVSPPANQPASKATKGTTTPAKDSMYPPGFLRKTFQGMLILMLGSFAILYGLQFLMAFYPQLGLNATIAPANVPILSGINWELLIFAVLILGLYLLIGRLGLLPKANTYAQTARASQGGTTGASGSSASAGGARKQEKGTPGIGERRTRAERRFAAEKLAEREARASAARAARENSGMRGMLNRTFKRQASTEKAPTAAAKAPGVAAKATTGSVAATSKSASAKPTKAAASVTATSSAKTSGSGHDSTYERVKADQRLRRRR